MIHLFPALEERYTKEHLSAREAQRLAEFIAWGPVVFQVARIMLKWGILDLIRDSGEGLTLEEIVKKTKQSEYAVKCLLEASLSIGILLVDVQAERYTLSKTGWFLINDPATRVNIDFNQDVNYEGWFHLLLFMKVFRSCRSRCSVHGLHLTIFTVMPLSLKLCRLCLRSIRHARCMM